MKDYASLRKKNNGALAAIIVLTLCVVLTATLLVLNLLSPLWNERIGIALNAALVIVSAPMVCSNFYVLPLFLWGTLIAEAFFRK